MDSQYVTIPADLPTGLGVMTLAAAVTGIGSLRTQVRTGPRSDAEHTQQTHVAKKAQHDQRISTDEVGQLPCRLTAYPEPVVSANG